MRLRVVIPAFVVGVTAAGIPAAAAATPPVQVLVHTRTAITSLALDRSGRAVWAQQDGTPGAFCYRLHRGMLLRHQNRSITRCRLLKSGTVENPIALVATSSSATARLRIVWAHGGGGLFDRESQVRVFVGGASGHVTVENLAVECGGEGCMGLGPRGNELGPMAARDGVVLYAVDDISGVAPCDPVADLCRAAVTGGRIRRVHYTADGATAATVPGAPAASNLATAAGRLAEQTFTADGAPAPEIQIRDVADGALRATIVVHGTLNTMAMSSSVLAALVTNAAGDHLVRWNAATGVLLGSTPVGATVARRTLSIVGPRILYETSRGMYVYRLDLGRTIAVGIGPRRSPALDADGIRWAQSDPTGPGSTIRGIALG